MKHFIQYRIMKEKRGFTVIEAFVGISILLIGLVGPLMLVNSNLQAGRFSRDQITAYYLAQEAIEMVREVRDENFLAPGSPSWLSGIHGDCFQLASTTRGCRVDGRPGVGTIQPCTNCETNALLRVDTNTGRYGHWAGGSASRFYRYIQIEHTDLGNSGAIVRVRVGFDTGRYIQEYTTTDYLRDWDPR